METIFERTKFAFLIGLKMLSPPIYSFSRLERSCRKWLEGNPSAYSPRVFLANLYKDYLKNEEAKSEFLEIQRLGYLTDRDRLTFGEVLYRLQEHEGVIETLSPIIDSYPNDKHANWYLGISYLELGNFGRASQYLERAISSGIRRPDDYWRLGICYDRIGELGKAAEAYQEALLGRPDSEDLKKNLTAVYVRLAKSLVETNPVQAERELRKAIELSPTDPEAVGLLALFGRK